MESEIMYSFELLPLVSGTDGVPDQYLLMNDDGTIISNDQVQDVSELTDVSDGAPGAGGQPPGTLQHYYVDTGGADVLMGEELVLEQTVNDESFANEFYIQDHDGSSIQVVDHIGSCSMEVESADLDPDLENCTQVTLSEEQCRQLERGGRVLLRLERETYALDALGLHEVTVDHELIQDLEEGQCAQDSLDNNILGEAVKCKSLLYEKKSNETVTVQFDPGASNGNTCGVATVVPDSGATDTTVEAPAESTCSDAATPSFKNLDVLGADKQIKKGPRVVTRRVEVLDKVPLGKIKETSLLKINHKLSPIKEHAVADSKDSLQTSTVKISTAKSTSSPTILRKVRPNGLKRVFKTFRKPCISDQKPKDDLKSTDENLIKLTVDYNVDEIPDKIFIGYTETGNKLFANVIDVKRNVEHDSSVGANKESKPDTKSVLSTKVTCNRPKGEMGDRAGGEERAGGEAGGVPAEVRRLLRSGAWRASSAAGDVTRAARTVAAMLRRPDVRPLLLGRRVLHTESVHTAAAAGEARAARCAVGAVVEGRVARVRRGAHEAWTFLLDRPTDGSGEAGGDTWRTHLHVSETRRGALPPTTTVAVQRMHKPVSNKTKILPIQACVACASIFSSEEELLEHQKIHQDSAVTDTSVSALSTSLPASDVKSSRNYCHICKKTFDRTYNLQRHNATHCSDADEPNIEARPPEPADTKFAAKRGRFACNICSCSYNYSSTLSRHILADHITFKCPKLLKVDTPDVM